MLSLLSSALAAQPHLLFVLADDFGYNDIGYHQNAVSPANPKGIPTTNAAAGVLPTPKLDKLASEGVKLASYYVQPLCSPTRAALMTGRYPQHTGIGPDVDRIDWCAAFRLSRTHTTFHRAPSAHRPHGVPARETFLPELLRDRAGYDCHMVGKWVRSADRTAPHSCRACTNQVTCRFARSTWARATSVTCRRTAGSSRTSGMCRAGRRAAAAPLLSAGPSYIR